MADKILVSDAFPDWKEKRNKNKNNFVNSLKRITNDKSIKLCPLWAYIKGGDDFKHETMALPISPSDIMFTCDSNTSTLNLMNYGELPVSQNRKLATWSVTSMFPKKVETTYTTTNNNTHANRNRYWFDLSNDNGQGDWDGYKNYCDKLYGWKIAQTPLVFMYDTWGEYYYCQIKTFKYGEKDATGMVYYDLQFQEYKKYDKFDTSYASTDYSSDIYYCDDGDTIISIAKKIYGSSEYWSYLMTLNGLDNPEVKVGQALKVR